SALGPAELLQALPQGRRPRAPFRIIVGIAHQHRDAPHAIAGLRTGGERPQVGSRGGTAGKQRDEVAASHSVTLPWEADGTRVRRLWPSAAAGVARLVPPHSGTSPGAGPESF